MRQPARLAARNQHVTNVFVLAIGSIRATHSVAVVIKRLANAPASVQLALKGTQTILETGQLRHTIILLFGAFGPTSGGLPIVLQGRTPLRLIMTTRVRLALLTNPLPVASNIFQSCRYDTRV